MPLGGARSLQKEHAELEELDNPGKKEKNCGRLRLVFDALVDKNKTFVRAIRRSECKCAAEIARA